MVEHAGRGFEPVATVAVTGEEREREVRVLELVALDEPTDPDRLALLRACALGHGVGAEPEARLLRERLGLEVLARGLEGPQALVGDELQPAGLVRQLDEEGGVLEGQVAQQQVLGLEAGHVVRSPRVMRYRTMRCRRSPAGRSGWSKSSAAS